MKQDIFDKIKEASQDGIVTPSNAVWDKLERKLGAESHSIPPPRGIFQMSIKKWSIAASVLVLIAAYGILNNLGSTTSEATAIPLEDLHTLEVNPRYNISPVGESSTIPSIRMARSINATYKGIDEGSADKKLMKRKIIGANNTEYGLG